MIGWILQLKISTGGDNQSYANTPYLPLNACIVVCGIIILGFPDELWQRKWFGMWLHMPFSLLHVSDFLIYFNVFLFYFNVFVIF